MKRIINRIIFESTTRFPRLITRKVVREKIDGISYELDLTETIDRNIHYLGYWEKNTSECLKKYLKPDMTVFEIGSNIGAHSFQIAKSLRNGNGRLHAFEPASYAFKKLKKNYKLNDFDNIVLNNKGLSDEEKIMTLDRAHPCFRSSWNVKDGPGVSKKMGDTITLETLDGYVARNHVNNIDMIKIDTDGYELKILRGGINSISVFKPIIIIEVSNAPSRVGDSAEKLIDSIESLDYRMYSLLDETPLSRQEILDLIARINSFDILLKPVNFINTI